MDDDKHCNDNLDDADLGSGVGTKTYVVNYLLKSVKSKYFYQGNIS